MDCEEVTVLLDMNEDDIISLLKEEGFYIKEKYVMKDIYFYNKDISLVDSYLDIVCNCFLVRELKNEKKIMHKYKELDNNGNIIKQGKSSCTINDIDEAISFFDSFGYKELITIKDELTIFTKDNIEFALQKVNDRDLYIEIESDDNFKNSNEIITYLNKFNIKIKNNDYFAKKLELELIYKYGKK